MSKTWTLKIVSADSPIDALDLTRLFTGLKERWEERFRFSARVEHDAAFVGCLAVAVATQIVIQSGDPRQELVPWIREMAKNQPRFLWEFLAKQAFLTISGRPTQTFKQMGEKQKRILFGKVQRGIASLPELQEGKGFILRKVVQALNYASFLGLFHLLHPSTRDDIIADYFLEGLEKVPQKEIVSVVRRKVAEWNDFSLWRVQRALGGQTKAHWVQKLILLQDHSIPHHRLERLPLIEISGSNRREGEFFT